MPPSKARITSCTKPRKAGVRVGSIFQARFGDAARALKAAIDAGRFGRMVLASCYVKWNRTAEYYTGWKGKISEDGGGAVINQAIHGVDLLQWFAGMPVEVFAWSTQRVHKIESEDTCGGRAEVRQRCVRHHRSEYRAMAGLCRAASRSAARTARPSWKTTTSRAGSSAWRSPKTKRSARPARSSAKGSGVGRSRWPSTSKVICARSRISSTVFASSGRSSSKAARRARPWRWCGQSTTRRRRDAPVRPDGV